MVSLLGKIHSLWRRITALALLDYMLILVASMVVAVLLVNLILVQVDVSIAVLGSTHQGSEEVVTLAQADTHTLLDQDMDIAYLVRSAQLDTIKLHRAQ